MGLLPFVRRELDERSVSVKATRFPGYTTQKTHTYTSSVSTSSTGYKVLWQPTPLDTPKRRRLPTGVDNPEHGLKNGVAFPLYMFRRRHRCFNFGSQRHIHWLLRLRYGCVELIEKVDEQLEKIHLG